MAVSVTESPTSVVPIGEGVRWALLLDSFGTDPITKKIGFQILDEDGNELTPLRSVKPPGDGVPVDFIVEAKKVILDAGLIKTKIPTLGYGGGGSAENDDEIMKGVKLLYGDLVFDATDCTSENNVSTETPVVDVINSALNRWDDKDFTGGDTIVLNNMPKCLNIARDSVVWLWVFNGSGVTCTHTAYYRDGTTAQLIANSGFDVAIFAMSNAALAGYFDIDKLIKIEHVFALTGGDVTYTTIYTCNEATKVYHEVHALDPLGGYNTLVAEQATGSSGSDSDVLRFSVDKGNPNYATDGYRVLRKETRASTSLFRRFPNDEDNAKYALALSAATKFLIRVNDENGGAQLVNFIADDDGVQVFRTDSYIEISLSGFIGQPIENQL